MTITITFDETDANAVHRLFLSMGNRLLRLTVGKIMAQIDDLNAALDAEGADVTAILAVLAADVAAIQAAQAQITTLSANQAPDLTAAIKKVNDMTAALAASLPAPATPADAAATVAAVNAP